MKIQSWFKSFLLLLVGILVFKSCNKDEDLERINYIYKEARKSILSFDPPEVSWYRRLPPDSIVVNISGGNPPYIITKRNEYDKLQVIIKNNQLICYPRRDFNADSMIYDTIQILDNDGNIGSLNYTVNSLTNSYHINKSSYNLKLIGTDTFQFNAPINGIGYWDELRRDFHFHITDKNGVIGIDILNVDSVGIYPITSWYDFGLWVNHNGVQEFRLVKNTTQYVTITKLEKEVIELDIDLNLVGDIPGSHRLKGKMKLVDP